MSMAIVMKQLNQARADAEKHLSRIQEALRVLGPGNGRAAHFLRQGTTRHHLSPEARKRIAQAQKQRWAKLRKQKGVLQFSKRKQRSKIGRRALESCTGQSLERKVQQWKLYHQPPLSLKLWPCKPNNSFPPTDSKIPRWFWNEPKK